MTNTIKHLIGGIIHVTGEPDVGKTTFALTTGSPYENIAFLDNDVKGGNIVDQIRDSGYEFAYYQNLTEVSKGLKPVDFHKKCLQFVKDMQAMKGKIHTIVWDNYGVFEETFHPYVCENMGQFKKHWSPNGKIKNAEKWKVSFGYEGQFLSDLMQIANVVVVITHLKNYYKGSVQVPGKQVPEGKRPLVQKAQLRFWLRHNDSGSPIPTGLLLKRISKWGMKDGRPGVVNVFPRRIPTCDWQHLEEYWENPVDGIDRVATKEERPNEYEMSLISGELTQDQQRVFEMEAERAKEDEKELDIFFGGIKERVLALWDETDGEMRPRRFVRKLQKQDDDFYDLTEDDLEVWLDERKSSKKKSRRGKKKEYEEMEDDEIPT